MLFRSGKEQYEHPKYMRKPSQIDRLELFEELGAMGLQKGQDKLKNVGNKIGNIAGKVGKTFSENHNKLQKTSTAYSAATKAAKVTAAAVGTAALSTATTLGEVTAAAARDV